MDNSTAREGERENINFTQYLSNIVWTWAQCRVTGEESVEWGVVQQQQQCVASFIYLFLFFPFLFFSMFSSSSPQLRSILFVVVFSTHLSHLQF